MKGVFLLIKLLLSIALVSFFISKVNINAISGIMGTSNGIKALIVSTAILTIQAFLAGLRLPYILKLYGKSIDIFKSIQIWFVGAFFSQTMISFVGGDAVRIWCLKRIKMNTREAASAILLDRVIGFSALIALFLLMIPFLMKILDDQTMRYGILLLAFASTAMVTVFILLGKAPTHLRDIQFLGFLIDIGSNARYLFVSYKNSLMAFMISFGIQLLNIFVIYIIFRFYETEVPFFWCMILTTPVMLISMLPISIAGWGVRETAMISGFSLLGFSTDVILAVSVTFGIAVFASGIPGIFLFICERKRTVMALENGRSGF